MITDYLLENHSDDIREILASDDDSIFYSIEINFIVFALSVGEISAKILRNPMFYLPKCDESAIKAQENLATADQIVKRNIHVRIALVPVERKEAGFYELVSINGIVMRTSQPDVIKTKKRYRCSKCKHITVEELDWERLIFQDPGECETCHSPKIKALADLEKGDTSDHQNIKVYESLLNDKVGGYSVGLPVTLLDDLVDKCRPGDEVDISGIMIRRFENLTVGKRAIATMVVLANNVKVVKKLAESRYTAPEIKDIFCNYWKKYADNPLLGRNNIVASICPELYGMFPVKLALAIVLAGGVSKTAEAGLRTRGDPHLLMVGDPGTGKSQLLRAAVKLSLRSVCTTGVGSTAAGLTASAVKDGDGWHLEGGALVLADGGVCCIDELTTMSSKDRTSMHEAMEQQTISFAKAGMVTKLRTRCSIVAAINPQGGHFENDFEWKTTLGDALLSRFDLIMLLKDVKNREFDRKSSEHILRSARGDVGESEKKASKGMDLIKSEGLWKEDSLREYFAHIHSLKPVLSKDAKKIIKATFLYKKSHPLRKAERTTVRLLESLFRLAEGHARLMYRSEVTTLDAIFVADLIGVADHGDIDINLSAPDDPIDHYRSSAQNTLAMLGLSDSGIVL